ncbi:MAG: type II toxin-antitoxin system HicB family antitoxin [Gammaproteobacteria bacterium]
MTNVVEAIECHLEGMLFDGGSIPEAQPVEVHQRDKAYAGGTWALVSVDLSSRGIADNGDPVQTAKEMQ